MLRCPVCVKTDMAVLELHEIEIDYCFSCAGIWLDEGELELLLEGSEKKEEITASFRELKDCECSEARRPCPICGRNMMKVELDAGDKKVLIDKCPDNHGLWFDHGELFDVINSSIFDENNPVLLFLRDIFMTRNNCQEENK
jgi:uncharacterized protein